MPTQTPVSPCFDEESIRFAIQDILKGSVDFGATENLISLGLDSLKIMRLATLWRKEGAAVDFASLMESPTLEAWVNLLNHRCIGETETVVTPQVPPVQNAPFPLTDVQHAYWIGRRDSQPLGGVGCHAYIELDGVGIRPERLQDAWRHVQEYHPMLRARFRDDGLQEIMECPSLRGINVSDLRHLEAADVQAALLATRRKRSHHRFAVEQGEIAALELSLLPDNRTRIHFHIDLLVADVHSLHLILQDIALAYQGIELSKEGRDWNFAEYLQRRELQEEQRQKEAGRYWAERIPDLPEAPAFPMKCDPSTVRNHTFERRSGMLAHGDWVKFKNTAASYGITPAMALLGLYAEILAHWSEHAHFLLSLPLFDRPVDEQGVDRVVADFTNLLVLEADCSESDMPFIDRVRRIQRRFNEDVAYSAYSGVRVQRDISRQRGGRGLSAPAVFAYNADAPLVSPVCRDTLGSMQYMISQTPQVCIDLQIYDTEEGMLFAWDAVDALFPAGMLDAMVEAFNDRLRILAEQQSLWEQPLLPVAVQDGPAVTEPLGLEPDTLHGPFFAKATSMPEQVALINPRSGEHISYRELARRARAVMVTLLEAGVEKGDAVAVSLPRGEEQVAAVLGVLAAGGVYVPVNPEMPLARRQRIHARAGIRSVITNERLARAKEWPEQSEVLFIDGNVDACSEHFDITNDPFVSAYIIFTSGSTGEPKGVRVTHKAARATIDAVNTLYEVTAEDRAIGVSSLDFDLSVYDIFGLLGCGGSLVLVDEAAYRDATLWATWIAEYNVTLWNSVPLLLEMLCPFVDNEIQIHVRLALLSGDRIPLGLPEEVWRIVPGCRLVAMGGATEGAIWSNHIEVPRPLPAAWTSIPYGRPLPGQAYRVVDGRGRDCPPWKPGELWIGGCGVAEGYTGDVARTNERFVEHGGGRWYRTGDRGRFWPDGILEFLGREDLQVKIRGHRIELGEIESALRCSDSVAEAVVTVAAESGPAFLVAHVVPALPVVDEDKGIAELANHLRTLVPEYMQPSRWAFLKQLPLSSNGKVDRKALGVPAKAEYRSVTTHSFLEEALAVFWREVLGQQVDRQDNFFSMGGDSLLATRLVARIRQALAPDLPLDALFLSPTIAGLAQHPAFVAATPGSADDVSSILPDPLHRYEPFPLTDVQHTYWIGRTEAYSLGNVATHVFFEFDSRPLDLERLRKAWEGLVSRHGMLRTVFLDDGTQRELVHAASCAFSVEDMRNAPAGTVQKRLSETRAAMEVQVLPIETGPLYDIRIIRHWDDNGERQRIFFDIDALIADASSVFLLIDEWFQLYDAPDSALSETEFSFRDYVMAEQNRHVLPAYERDWAYWRNRISQLPPAPELPLCSIAEHRAARRFVRKSGMLSRSTWHELKQRLQNAGLSASGLLIAAYAEILGRWSKNSHFTLNITLFNRPPLHEEIGGVVGDFTSLLLLEVDLNNGGTVLDRVRSIQAQLWRDMDHRGVSGVEVLRELTRLAGGRTVTMPVVFTGAAGLGGSGRDASSLARLGTLVAGVAQTPQVWLDHQAYEQDGALVFNWDALEGLFPEGMVEDMFDAYGAYLTQLAVDGEAWLQPPNIPLPVGQAAVRARVNDTAQQLVQPILPGTLHALVVQQAVRHPDAVAVISPEGSVTYEELITGADLLAESMRVIGIGAGSVVGVALHKGWQQIVSVLAVLATGAAYLPLDPSLPAERFRALLQDSGAAMVLGERDLPQALGNVPRLDTGSMLGQNPRRDMASCLAGWTVCQKGAEDALAYIIYTSGSTGKPKGVMIDHKGAVNTILDINRRFAVGNNDRVFGLSALTFDLSVYDIFGPLVVGGALVLPSPERLRDPDHWLQIMRTHKVSLWNSVPALLQMLVVRMAGTQEKLPDSLRLALLSGDWIPLDLADSVTALGNIRVVGLGGATEASIWSVCHEITGRPHGWNSVPYGRPLGNQTMRVLNGAYEDCPDWVTGQIHIGGVGLAKGYWKDAEKTEAAFVRDPATGERLYRTGDLGRYRPSGDIEFIGRIDTQVKIGGFRIELAEVEAALGSCSMVRDAAVIVGTNDRLVGMIIPQAGVSADAAVPAARRRAEELLPSYMVPSQILPTDAFPLTANGKVDRNALEGIVSDLAPPVPQFSPPTTESERILADVWADLLNVPHVDIHTHFFEAGGNSLLAVQVMNRLRSIEAGLSVIDLFEHPTVASLAQHMDSRRMPNVPQKTEGENKPAQADARLSMRREQNVRNRRSAYRSA